MLQRTGEAPGGRNLVDHPRDSVDYLLTRDLKCPGRGMKRRDEGQKGVVMLPRQKIYGVRHGEVHLVN